MKTVRVVAAAIEQEGKVLATQRDTGDFAGGWEFPGGKIEPGETPEEALEREIREELDARIIVGGKIVQVEFDYPTFHLSMGVYACHLCDAHFELREHRSACWVGSADANTLVWLPADTEVLSTLASQGIMK